MTLLQWHKVYKFSEDELHRAPVVALTCVVFLFYYNYLIHSILLVGGKLYLVDYTFEATEDAHLDLEAGSIVEVLLR